MLNNLLGFLIEVFYGSERYKNHRRQAARRRGLEYALAEIYEAKDVLEVIVRLESEASNPFKGKEYWASEYYFDEAILEVVRAASLRNHTGILTQ